MLDAPQRTAAWFQARVGKVTASRITDVLAELTNKKTEATVRRNYRRELVLERYSGIPQESGYTSFAMQQGIVKEQTARHTYAFAKGIEIEEVGFIEHPTIALTGASPDGFLGDDGIVELKAPEANAMWEMLVGSAVDKKYRDQVMWQLACCPKRKWADLVFYREGLPLEIIRIERDDQAIAQMEQAVRQFLAEVDSEYQMLCKRHPK